MKLLYKPTGNIFTLPDEEALKIKASGKENYEIIDCGISKPEQKTSVSKKKVKEIEEERAALAEQEEEEMKHLDDPPAVKRKYANRKVYELPEKLEDLTSKELEVFVRKLGYTGDFTHCNTSKAKMIELIRQGYKK